MWDKFPMRRFYITMRPNPLLYEEGERYESAGSKKGFESVDEIGA